MKLLVVSVLFAIVAYASAAKVLPREYYGFIQELPNGEMFEILRPDDVLNPATCNPSKFYSPISCSVKCQSLDHWGGFCKNNICMCHSSEY